MTSTRVLADRRHLWAFVIGCVAVTTGVLLHLPMLWMGRDNAFHLAGMPMDAEMLWGMLLIISGVCVAGFGLVPRVQAQPDALPHGLRIVAPEDAPLGWAHWRLMLVLTVALVIDVMKPASLGFVVPGMTREYEVAKTTIAWLPFAALCGTVVGSVLWGWLADLYGRRASILLSAVMFVGTSICGAMPSLWWNVGMCFLMGAAAGGMLPVAYALLAETMPSRHRGWVLVLVGGLGAVGGYLAASGCAAWLEPIFSWRVLWFLNLPTGLALIFLNAFIPESPKFLLQLGRIAEMHETLRGFGCIVRAEDAAPDGTARGAESAATGEPRLRTLPGLVGPTWALSIAAFAWGLINFGLLLWMPAHLVAKGYSMRLSSELLAASALIALPTVFVGGPAVQPLEQQGRAAQRDPADRDRARWRRPPRTHRAGECEPGLANRAVDRRHQRHHRDAAAVRGRDLPPCGARPRDRLGGSLHQGRRARGATAEPAGARAVAAARSAGDSRAGAGLAGACRLVLSRD